MESQSVDTTPKPTSESKTIWFNVAAIAEGLLEVTQYLTAAHVIPPGIPTIAVGSINILLRFISTRPLTLFGKIPFLGKP